jgi:hypothetical protein
LLAVFFQNKVLYFKDSLNFLENLTPLNILEIIVIASFQSDYIFVIINQTSSPLTIKIFMDFEQIFQDFKISKSNGCPLCKKHMNYQYVKKHLEGTFCNYFINLTLKKKLEILNIFYNIKKINNKTNNRELTIEEQFALTIKKISGYAYNPLLNWYCQLIDNRNVWILNKELSKSTIGNKWIKRGQRGKNKGQIKKLEYVEDTTLLGEENNTSFKKIEEVSDIENTSSISENLNENQGKIFKILLN